VVTTKVQKGEAIIKNKISAGMNIVEAALVVVSGLKDFQHQLHQNNVDTYGSPLWSEYDGQVSFEFPCSWLRVGSGKRR
jgi:hypothetical protein